LEKKGRIEFDTVKGVAGTKEREGGVRRPRFPFPIGERFLARRGGKEVFHEKEDKIVNPGHQGPLKKLRMLHKKKGNTPVRA